MSLHHILSELRLDAVRAHVEHIANHIPSRLAGSPNGARMAEYSAGQLRDAGLSVRIEDGEGLVSFPEPGALTVLGPQDIAIEAFTLGHSLSTLPEGITATLVDVGGGGFADYAGVNARGCITLSELSYHPARHEKQRIAALQGAVGCVMMNWGRDDSTAVPFGSVKPAWGNPTPHGMREEMATLPCIGISRVAGLALRAMLRQGPVRVRLLARAENRWAPVHVTVGELAVPGTEDFVLLGGHQDSWFGPQPTDNATGNACMLELARVFARHRGLLRRGLVCGFWAGHETGTMIGSSRFADRHWDRLRAHAVAYLQIDQPGCLGVSEWSASSNAELRRFHQQVEAAQLPDWPRRWHRAGKMGDASFFGLGIPMFGGQGGYNEAELAATAGASVGWWHHSLENTLDKVDWPSIPPHLRIYAAYLWGLLTEPVLPLDYTEVTELFVSRLAALAPAAPELELAPVLDHARALQGEALALSQLADGWRARYAADPGLGSTPADQLNRCFRALSRLLIPLASTACGAYAQDPYGYTPQTTMIPSLFDIPALAEAAPEQRRLMEVSLRRARNQVSDALQDARALIAGTRASLPPA
jgi:hypothetical protein